MYVFIYISLCIIRSFCLCLLSQSFKPQSENRRQRQDQLQRRPDHHGDHQPPDTPCVDARRRRPPRTPAQEAAAAPGPPRGPEHPDNSELSRQQHRQSLGSVTFCPTYVNQLSRRRARKRRKQTQLTLTDAPCHPSHMLNRSGAPGEVCREDR